MNPANLKWRYLLEDIQSSSPSAGLRSKVKMCLSSLSKFPLVLHDLNHCKMLKYFDQEIVRLMAAVLEGANEEGSTEMDLDPIHGVKESLENSTNSTDLLKEGSENSQSSNESHAAEASQEETDYQIALRLSMEEEEMDLEENLPCSYKNTVTSIISIPVDCPSPISDIVISPPPTFTEDLESDDDPFELEKPKKTRRLAKTKTTASVLDKFPDDPEISVPKKDPKTRKPRRKTNDDPPSLRSSLSDSFPNDDDGVTENTQCSTGSDKYRPKPGSAGYALLLALYKEELSPDFQGYLSKSDLCKLAQQYTETNLKHSYAGSTGPQSWYSGWSSASTLIKKGLIKTWSNPLKIKLTDKGKDIAGKLSETRELAENVHSQSQNERSSNSVFSDASWLNDVSLGVNSRKLSDEFRFCYISSTGRETGNQDLADIHIDGEVYYMVKCSKEDLERSGKTFKLVTPTVEGQIGMCIAYLEESCCLATECLPNLSAKSSAPRQAPSASVSKPVPETKPSDFLKSAVEGFPSLSGDLNLGDLPENWIINDDEEEDGLKHHNLDANHESFALRSGCYEIVLLVDAMEVTGGSHGGKKSRKIFTLEELEHYKVNFDCRKLNIGDFAWVAREKRTDEPKELVLPYIVERKRMDDLRSSIMDGRYHEQKSRLKLSGIKVKFYLVEEACLKAFSTFNGPRALDRQTLEQAITNTCMRDGFRIRRTKTQKDTCRFLASFTRVLIEKYEGKDLHSCPFAQVQTVKSWETSLLTFKDFHEHSRPDKAMTVREAFSNMLICQKGLSAGMAWAITEKYPTPCVLQAAFETCVQGEDEKLLAGLTYERGKKKIPLSISKTVALVFKETTLN